MSNKTSHKSSHFHRFKDYLLGQHPLVLPTATFIMLFFISLGGFVASGSTTIGASDTRVVQLSVDGKSQTFPTRAKNVEDLLARLDITLNEKDIVEPALDTEIIDDNFSVNVYKARPVTILDEGNGQEVTTVTAHPAPRQVAENAGIEVYPEDIIKKQEVIIEPQNVLREGLVAERVVIERATPTSISLYGTAINVRTHAKTVRDVLAERNIQTLADDVITPALDTLLTKGTQVYIVRVGTQVETVEEEIPAPVETIQDPNMAAGTQSVREPGTPGRKIVTYQINLENNQEASRSVLQEVIAEEPIKRVVVEGTKVIISNPSENVALGQRIAAEMGYADQFGCIYQIFQRESGWNHAARNRSSGAFGIPQALPATKMGANYTDPEVQIRWGIGYMVNRYGSPCGAQAFWNVNHWY